MEPALAEAVRPVAEHLQAVQDKADLAHYNDRFDSGRQQIDFTNQLQPRGRVTVEINVPHSAPPAVTTGPTPYEEQKAQEDAWE